MSDVQLFVARATGCATWSELLQILAVDAAVDTRRPARRPVAIPPTFEDVRSGMLHPVELRIRLPMELQAGVYSTTTDVWQMLTASKIGDLPAVRTFVAATPGVARCEYN